MCCRTPGPRPPRTGAPTPARAAAAASRGPSDLHPLAEPARCRAGSAASRPDLELLDRPGVAVGVGEAEERAAVALVEDDDLAALDAAAHQLRAGGRGIGDDELQPAQRAGRHLVLRRQVADDDRAARPRRGQLDDVHVLVPGVVVEREADLVAVERDRRGRCR